MPSFPSTLATPYLSSGQNQIAMPCFFWWIKMSSEKELLKFFQNWYFVFKRTDFSRPSILICRVSSCNCYFAFFTIGQQRFSFDSSRNGQGIQANVYKREHCIMRQHDVPDFVPSPFVSRFAKTTCNLELKKPRKAFLSASPISTVPVLLETRIWILQRRSRFESETLGNSCFVCGTHPFQIPLIQPPSPRR